MRTSYCPGPGGSSLDSAQAYAPNRAQQTAKAANCGPHQILHERRDEAMDKIEAARKWKPTKICYSRSREGSKEIMQSILSILP